LAAAVVVDLPLQVMVVMVAQVLLSYATQSNKGERCPRTM
jgi:hypothetical protein